MCVLYLGILSLSQQREDAFLVFYSQNNHGKRSHKSRLSTIITYDYVADDRARVYFFPFTSMFSLARNLDGIYGHLRRQVFFWIYSIRLVFAHEESLTI